MRVAVHPLKGSFTDRAISYLSDNGIDYTIVNCFDNDIMKVLKDFDILIWHWTQNDPRGLLAAKQILISAEIGGLVVFPDFNTIWHFDDKLGQKYMLESIDAPMAKSFVFYTKENALNWIENCNYPVVFKLRGGAGARNVKLLKNKRAANRIVKRSFAKGIVSQPGYMNDFKVKIKKTKNMKDLFARILRIPSTISKLHYRKKYISREKGYALFQEFLPDNQYDTRVAVVNNKAWAFRRKVRKNDFRASGSGSIDWDVKNIDLRAVKIAFIVSEKLALQAAGFDFIRDQNGDPKIIEVSYGWAPFAIHACSGYWDMNMKYYGSKVFFEDELVQSLIDKSKQQASR
jgi:glutathione synthase/RimK-type ligase-like ATP-grasp enzyme